MADATIALKTKNVFGLPSSFGLQNANRKVGRSMPTAFGNTGACAASDSLEGRIDYSQTARYRSTTLRTDLGSLATAFGQVSTAEYSVVPTDLNLSYSASDNATLTFKGHNHESNAHSSMSVTADISKIIPQAGFGVPSFGITLGSNCSPFSADISAQIEHFDVNDADGTHIHGENTEKVSCGLFMTFSGIPTTTDEATLETELKAYFAGQGITISHLTVTGTDENNANSQFDGFALAAEFYAISD